MNDGYGADGYGPPASPEVAKATAPFFSGKRIELDPDQVKRIATQVAARQATVSWKSHRRP